MFNLRDGREDVEVIQAADKLAQFVLNALYQCPLENPHRDAILVVLVTWQLLRATYGKPDELVGIETHALRLIEAFANPVADA
jgi:hypothetical protein